VHNNVSKLITELLVFEILPTPGPGAYALVAEVQNNGKQMISKYERTKTPMI
jgi:hypothetical protein